MLPFTRCYIENCDADDYSASETNQFSPIWLNNTIPRNDDNTPDQCKRYNYTWTNVEECQAPDAQIDSEITCDRRVYDTSQFQSTIVTDVSWEHSILDLPSVLLSQRDFGFNQKLN